MVGLDIPFIDGKTTLIDLEKHQDLLNKWFDDKLLQLKVLYRGSSHLFSKQSFVANCHY
jgi:hypothetical protein